jgi:hypothetical protein
MRKNAATHRHHVRAGHPGTPSIDQLVHGTATERRHHPATKTHGPAPQGSRSARSRRSPRPWAPTPGRIFGRSPTSRCTTSEWATTRTCAASPGARDDELVDWLRHHAAAPPPTPCRTPRTPSPSPRRGHLVSRHGGVNPDEITDKETPSTGASLPGPDISTHLVGETPMDDLSAFAAGFRLLGPSECTFECYLGVLRRPQTSSVIGSGWADAAAAIGFVSRHTCAHVPRDEQSGPLSTAPRVAGPVGSFPSTNTGRSSSSPASGRCASPPRRGTSPRAG